MRDVHVHFLHGNPIGYNIDFLFRLYCNSFAGKMQVGARFLERGFFGDPAEVTE